MSRLALIGVVLALSACNKEAAAPVAAQAPAPAAAEEKPAEAKPEAAQAPRPDLGGTVAGVAAGSKDHTTLVAALQAADLVTSLGSPGGAYTVFAPTNAAFEALPPGTVEGLLKPEKKEELKKILSHHACVPVLKAESFTEGQVLSMADGTKVTLHVQDGKVKVEDANIIASVPASNGIVHVIDKILLPPAK